MRVCAARCADAPAAPPPRQSFQERGGAALLLYSVALTRGFEALKRDMARARHATPPRATLHAPARTPPPRTRPQATTAGSPPLVVGPSWLCSFELVMLMLTGRAANNIGAYHPLNPAGGKAISPPPPLPPSPALPRLRSATR